MSGHKTKFWCRLWPKHRLKELELGMRKPGGNVNQSRDNVSLCSVWSVDCSLTEGSYCCWKTPCSEGETCLAAHLLVCPLSSVESLMSADKRMWPFPILSFVYKDTFTCCPHPPTLHFSLSAVVKGNLYGTSKEMCTCTLMGCIHIGFSAWSMENLDLGSGFSVYLQSSSLNSKLLCLWIWLFPSLHCRTIFIPNLHIETSKHHVLSAQVLFCSVLFCSAWTSVNCCEIVRGHLFISTINKTHAEWAWRHQSDLGHFKTQNHFPVWNSLKWMNYNKQN